jgi:hypothetical protein
VDVLAVVVGSIIAAFIAALCALVVVFIATNKIDISYLISEEDGKASLSRFQFLIFTFVIAMSFFLVTVGQSPPKLPDIPPGVFALLGISAGSYVVSKGIQTARDTSPNAGPLPRPNPPQPNPLTASFTPNLLPYGVPSTAPWRHENGEAVAPAGQVNASGMMDVQLSSGRTILNLRVIGSKGSGNIDVTLFRRSLTTVGGEERVGHVNIPAARSGFFDVTDASTPSLSTVDSGRFHYYVTAELAAADPNATEPVALNGFLVGYSN